MAIPAPFKERLARIYSLLDDADADLLLIDYSELIAWASGYITGETLYRVCMVPREGEPWMVLRRLDAPQAQNRSWMSDISGFPDSDDPYTWITDSIRDRGLAGAKIAVDSSSYSHTVHTRQRLQEALPDAVFIDLPGISSTLRAVKDSTEIDYLQQASKVADQSMERLQQMFAPGMSSRDAGAIAAASYMMFGGDDGQVGRICKGSGGFGFLHAELDDIPLQMGDVLHAELVPRVNHYSARLMRPISLGPPDGDLKKIATSLIHNQDLQIEAMSDGAVAADVDAILREGIVNDGIRDTYENVTGYNLGIYGRTPRPSDFSYIFLPNSDWKLQAGMVFHMYASAGGIAFSETVLVTENGGQRLTQSKRKILEVLIVEL
jgi:Xaa-Pro dipeptidase